jgi:ABC-type transport system involved in cytochrome bd biosynthesis fused ATPase/permease subunit
LIRKEFANYTVLTIAHTIAKVMDYDKIVVLDFGKVVEFVPHQPCSKTPTPSSIPWQAPVDSLNKPYLP